MAVKYPTGRQLDLIDVTAAIAVDPTSIGNIAGGLLTDPGAVAAIDGDYVRVDGTNQPAVVLVPGTAGDFAALNVSGEIVDSGVQASDLATAAQGTLADTALQPGNVDNVSELINDANYADAATVYTKAESDGTPGVAGAKIDKVSGGTTGNLVELDASGELVDAGGAIGDFLLNTTDTFVGTLTVTGDIQASGGVNALQSATTTIDVSAATAPTAGQILTAVSGTVATWQTVVPVDAYTKIESDAAAGLAGAKINKVAAAVAGNVATLAADGQLTDGGTLLTDLVTKVGTPVDNQLGVWTGDGTLEGDANLTWTGSKLAVAPATAIGAAELLEVGFDDATQNGTAIYFHSDNAASTGDLLYVETNGPGNALSVYCIGTGEAAVLATEGIITQPLVDISINNVSATGATLQVSTTGTGPVLFASGGEIQAAAGTVDYPSINIPEGVAPSSPVDGDVWVTAAGAFNARLNGATVDLASGIANVVSDTTPQLGGNLDTNAFNIVTAATTDNPSDSLTITTGAADVAVGFGNTDVGNITIQPGELDNQIIGATTETAGSLFLSGGDVDGGAPANGGGDVIIRAGVQVPSGPNVGDIIMQSNNPVQIAPQNATGSGVGAIELFEVFGGAESITVQAPAAITTSRTWVLPQDDPSAVAGDFLTTDASGNLSFATGLTSADIGVTVASATIPHYKSYSAGSLTTGSVYVGGFYRAPVSDVTLTIGGTVTQVYGVAGDSSAAHAFVVASGAGGTDLVLTVSGTSIDDTGSRTPADSEIIVADTDAATTDQYFETTKKWLGQITYTLTGAAGAFTFNYGLVKYEDFGNRNFTVTDFEATGLAQAAETGLDIELLHHEPTAFTYSAGSFAPNATPLLSLVGDHSTDDDVASGDNFAYKRAGLASAILGGASEGIIIRVSNSTNDSMAYMNFHVGVNF